MRTTLTIDDDLLAAARTLARKESKSVGRALSELARRGLEATPRVRRRYRSGIPLLETKPGMRPITLKDVRRLEDEP